MHNLSVIRHNESNYGFFGDVWRLCKIPAGSDSLGGVCNRLLHAFGPQNITPLAVFNFDIDHTASGFLTPLIVAGAGTTSYPSKSVAEAGGRVSGISLLKL